MRGELYPEQGYCDELQYPCSHGTTGKLVFPYFELVG